MLWKIILAFTIIINPLWADIKSDVSALIDGRAGYFAGTVMGDSMGGYYTEGDTVIIKPLEFSKIKVGQIAVYINRFGDIVIHRVEKIVEGGFQMRGATNKGCDSTLLMEDNLIGIAYGVIHQRGDFRKLLACREK